MMKAMRQMTKSIMWIVLAAFVGTIVFAWGMQFSGRQPQKRGIIGIINGQEIDIPTFQKAFQANLSRVGGDLEQEMSDDLVKRVRDNTWENFIFQKLLGDEIEKRGIELTNQEVYEYLKRFPPEDIRQADVFQTDGEFDYQKYLRALADPRIPWGQMEAMIRPQLKFAKLQALIGGLVRVSEEEIRGYWIAENQKVKVRYTFVRAAEFFAEAATVTSSEMQDFYERNLDLFEFEERAQLDYVRFVIKASSQDEDRVKVEALEIKELLDEDEDFGEVAEEYSQDEGSAAKGGDLGWFGKGDMVEPFEKAAFSLEVGQISEPVKTQFGWHLIKVSDRKKEKGEEKVEASHILLKVRPSEETREIIKSEAEYFAERAKKKGFSQIAQEDSLEITQTEPFQEDAFISGLIGANKQASQFAFHNKVGEVSDPVETNRALYVFRLAQRVPPGIQSLEEVRETLVEKVREEKRRKFAFQRAEEIQKEALKQKDLTRAAKKFDQEVNVTEEFTRNSFLPQFTPEVIGAAFALTPEHKISPAIETEKGAYVLELVSKEAIDDTAFQVVKDSLAGALTEKIQIDTFNRWYTQLKENAEIEDYLDQYYPY
jgi:peptidyl-prolyl cis-trans isomerase D